jgi:uncharacterized membrane protein
MVELSAAPLVLAFVITVVEMTEVVALVFALRGESGSVHHGALGATAGTATVALVALGAGAALLAVPTWVLLAAASITLFGFGVFLFRSTLKSYRKARQRLAPVAAPWTGRSEQALQFGGGFTIGAIEATETVVVLISLAAAGHGTSALVGSLVGGAVLVVAALLVHERIRRIKVPVLKLGATALLFTYAVFLGGEALHYPWPFADLFLLPLFAVAVVLVRGGVRLALGPTPLPVETKS